MTASGILQAVVRTCAWQDPATTAAVVGNEDASRYSWVEVSNPYRSLDDPDVTSFDHRVLEDVRDYGYHVAAVATDGSAPAWAYSVGFGATFNHPELVVFGLSVDVMHRMLRNAANEIREGQVLEDRSQSSELIAAALHCAAARGNDSLYSVARIR
jgi:hypothetical protein